MNTEIRFTYENTLVLNRRVLRDTLAYVRDQLLSHDINGGSRKLNMDTVSQKRECGTAACIGGWASIFLLGFEGRKTAQQGAAISMLFSKLIAVDRLHSKRDRLYNLFYSFGCTENYNQPNVAATAIQRYLDGQKPWPNGKMPNVLRYKRASSTTRLAR